MLLCANWDLVVSDVNKAVKLSRTLGSSDNFNLIVNTGFYKFTPTPQNAPIGCYGILTVYQSENYISQILQSMHHGTSAGIFFRYSYDSGSTWEPWIGKIVSNTFSYNIPTANEYVAVSSVTLPPHSLSTITAAVQRYTSTGSQCLGIVLSTSATSSDITYANTIAKKEQEPNMMDNLTVSATWLNSENTSKIVHMYVKQNKAGQATITVINDMHGYK